METNAANELLLFFLRGNPDESPPADIAQLAELDWDSVAQQARSHGLAPLLYHRLKNAAHVPASILQALRINYLESAWRNAQLYNGFAEVLTALRQAEIPVIVLKGAYLAQAVYGNIALRPMGDIDILVRKADLLKAESVLLELSYHSARTNDIESACAASQHLAPLIKKGAAAIEIHWTIVHPSCPFTIDVEGLWKRARPVMIDDVKVLSLSPEDLLIHLCINTVYHRLYRNVIVFSDVRETVRLCSNEIDWQQVARLSRQYGAGNAVCLTLYLAHTLFGASVPGKALDMLRTASFTPQIAVEAKNIIFNKDNQKKYANPYIIKFSSSISFMSAVMLLTRRICLSREELSEKYNIDIKYQQMFFYYALRMKDLLFQHSRTIWQIWRDGWIANRQRDLIKWLMH